MISRTIRIPTCPDDLDAEWLTGALGLGPVARVTATPVGRGLVADTQRLELTWAAPPGGPARLVAKTPAADPKARETARRYGHYRIETSFYRSFAPDLRIRTPRCYWAGFDAANGNFALVLEEARGREGSQLEGCSADDAAAALTELAFLHGPRWNDPTLGQCDWLDRYPPGYGVELKERLAAELPRFLDRFGDRLPPAVVDVVIRFVERADLYDDKGFDGPRTLSHGDFRNDNLIFSPERACVLDWQTVHRGAALRDVSYFLGGGLAPDVRRRCEHDLVAGYHRRLMAFGVDLSWDACWREYRRHAFAALAAMLKTAATVEMTAESDALCLTIIERAGTHALELEAEALL